MHSHSASVDVGKNTALEPAQFDISVKLAHQQPPILFIVTHILCSWLFVNKDLLLYISETVTDFSSHIFPFNSAFKISEIEK